MKRSLAVMLAAMFTAAAVLGTGCAAVSDSSVSSGNSDEAGAVSAPQEAETVTESAQTSGNIEKDGDITEIRVLLFDPRGVGGNSKEVIDAMNEITEETIGVRVEAVYASAADYATTANMMMAGGEQLDLLSLNYTPATAYNTLLANNQLMDISGLMEEYAPDTLLLMGDYIRATSKNGGIYAVPTFRNYASSVYAIMRKDVLDELGITEKAQNMTKWSEYKEILEEVREKTSYAPNGGLLYYSVISDSDVFAEATVFDGLSDNFRIVYTDSEGNVSLLQEKTEYKKAQDRIREMFDEGLIYKDMLMTDDHPDTFTKAGVVFSSLQAAELDVESSKKTATGTDVVCTELWQNLTASSNITGFGLAVPATSEEPEAAVRWINALWTDPRLENLVIWGIEGRDYVIENGEAAYPEDSDGNVPYHSATHLYGNQFNLLPWKGEGEDFRDISLDYLKASPLSPYLGFSLVQDDLANTMTALNSVYSEYSKRITYGSYDDEVWDEYVAKLKTAGAEEYLNAYQEQLSEWMKEK